MFRTIGKLTVAAALVLVSISAGALFSSRAPSNSGDTTSLAQSEQSIPAAPPTEMRTQNRSVLLATVTPAPTQTPTLLPPPTFEPSTPTPTPSTVPSVTPTTVTEINVVIPGLNGAETPTPTSTPGCEPREDWKLTYTVQFDDTLYAIAERYGTWIDELADANCIEDKNLIVVGQVLRVPGEAHPDVPEVECVPWEVLTPFNGSVAVPADGTITFNWIGPASQLNLIRIYRPDGTVYERLVELRQNETISLNDYLAPAGMYTWYVYPLGRDFLQIQCLEGGPWTFYKPLSSTPTPTVVAGGNGSGITF